VTSLVGLSKGIWNNASLRERLSTWAIGNGGRLGCFGCDCLTQPCTAKLLQCLGFHFSLSRFGNPHRSILVRLNCERASLNASVECFFCFIGQGFCGRPAGARPYTTWTHATKFPAEISLALTGKLSRAESQQYDTVASKDL
jgi:hypothetical protein